MKRLLIALLLMVLPIFTANAQGTLFGRADLDGNGSLDEIFVGNSFIRIAGGLGTVSRTYTFAGSATILAGGVQNMNAHVASAEIALSEIRQNQYTFLAIINHRTGVVQSFRMLPGWRLLAGGIKDLDGYPGAEIATYAVINSPNPAWSTSRIFIVTSRDGTRVEYGTNFGTTGYQTWQLLGIQNYDPNSPGLEIEYRLTVPSSFGNSYHQRRLYHRSRVTYDWDYPSFRLRGIYPALSVI
ncbi:MAG: hypothetical protein E6Q88_15065 [Lysobacteraceae bacterium]|nr:MAG: hypothetical protein E6Q88_15065 [Xanthomonadaceae bacterium]